MNSPTRLLGLALAIAASAPACASVFFAAHQDDVVLLMGRNAQRDIKGNLGYAIGALPDAMNAAEKQSQAAAFAALDKVLKEQGNITYDYGSRLEHLGSSDPFHAGFIGKQQWHSQTAGSGNCAF